MADYRFFEHGSYGQLVEHAQAMNAEDRHLKYLVGDENRMADFSLGGGGLFFDYSRQRVTRESMALLLKLADASGARARFADMARGKIVNVTEKRAALHTAARDFSDGAIRLGDRDVKADLRDVLEQIRVFSEKIHNGELLSESKAPFKHVVVVGIGGSYLGTEFVACALEAYADKGMTLDFLANVDIHNFGRIWSRIAPRQTLWVVISKSYTTAETMANEDLIRRSLIQEGIDPAKHIATVTAKGSPGDQGEGQGLAAFHMFDFIGGRYSVSSAVGGVPLSLYLGYERFERFLKGAEEMDRHALSAEPSQNIPLIAALISVWNNSFLGYPQCAIIPYASPLSKLAPHVQQLNMESNGKSVDTKGRWLDHPAGTVIFGEPGTNAQHSFFQLAHQGKPFPVEFIGVLNPQYTFDEGSFKGVGHQQELWANMLAQATALAIGKDNDNLAKAFSGNRPSSIVVLENLEPENVGRLLSFYEAKTVYEAFIWGINPFDQFGVELGKVTAGALRTEMAKRNRTLGHEFEAIDPINRNYLEMLFDGKLPA